MLRLLFATALLVSVPLAAGAHMVYLVPAKDGRSLTIVFSDSLEPDGKVAMDKIAGLKLVARTGGQDVPVEYTKGAHAFTADLPQTPAFVFGTVVYGLLARPDKPALLVYHPKAVFAGADVKAASGGEAVLEIVPVTNRGQTRFRLLAKGKPVAAAEGIVLRPDGGKEKVKTDADGFTPAFAQRGRYAAYLKLTETKEGKHDGKKYKEIRHYATLVVQVAESPLEKGSSPGDSTWDARAAAHLLSRAGFGGRPEEAAHLAALPLGDAVDYLLDMAAKAKTPSRPNWVRHPWVNTERAFADTPEDVRRKNHADTSQRYNTERHQLRSWWLHEMITTPAPLREKMVLFWHGHFTTASNKVGISQALYQQNETLRRHATGNFRKLLGDVTLDPAMMIYLDLEDSDRIKPNQNYARELLELFTLGIGNYTENDVLETARALTGWTLDAPPGTPRKGQNYAGAPRVFTRDGLVSTFRKERHDDGDKTILGRTGRLGVSEVLDLIVAHPACGRFLAGKLIDYFGASDPQGTLRERMAAAFVASKYEIRPMLKMLFTSTEFYARAARGRQIKSPVQLLVGACRQLHLKVEPTPRLAQLATAMGQELFNPPNVKGWPGGKAWISSGTLAVRYHLAGALLEGRMPTGLEPLGRERFLVLPREEDKSRDLLARLAKFDQERRAERDQDGLKVNFDVTALFPKGTPEDAGTLVDALLQRLVVTPVRPSLRVALVDSCLAVPVPARPALVIRLILSSPEFQMA